MTFRYVWQLSLSHKYQGQKLTVWERGGDGELSWGCGRYSRMCKTFLLINDYLLSLSWNYCLLRDHQRRPTWKRKKSSCPLLPVTPSRPPPAPRAPTSGSGPSLWFGPLFLLQCIWLDLQVIQISRWGKSNKRNRKWRNRKWYFES